MRKMLKDKNKDASRQKKPFVIEYPHETRVYSFTPNASQSVKRSQTPRWKTLYEDSITRK